MSKLLIYMPALNEEETICEVLQSIPKDMEGFSEVSILVVNDGSTDNSKEIVESRKVHPYKK